MAKSYSKFILLIFFLTGLVGAIAVGIGPTLWSGGAEKTAAAYVSASPTTSFDATEVWDVRLDFVQIAGLTSDVDPRFFGVRPNCSTGFDLVFFNGTCDIGRAIFIVANYKASFYYPANPNIVFPDDETRLLQSRYNAGTGEVLTWPLRIEISGASEGNTVSFSWATGDITSGPGSGDRPAVLKAGVQVGNQVVPVGGVLIDFATGAASGGVTCTPTATGHSCDLLTVGAGVTSVDELFVIVVGALPQPLALIDAPVAGNEGSPLTFDGSMSIPGTGELTNFAWNFGDSTLIVSGDSATSAIVTHTYAVDSSDQPGGTYAVTLVATDSSGATGSATHSITILNVAPSIISVSAVPTTVNEGNTSIISVAATDQGTGDIPDLRYRFDCNGDGGFEVGQQASNSTNCIFPDGPDSVTVVAEVNDQDGGITTGSVPVTVNNVPPNIISVVASPAVLPSSGGTSTITVTASDVAADLPLVYFFDCNGDNILEIGPQTGNNSATCAFTEADLGTNTVNVKVVDKDGGVATDSAIVTVQPPVALDQWVARIDIDPIAGLSGDLDPRFFGINPVCTAGFDIAFINGPCDVGRDASTPVDFMAYFYYPANTDVIFPDDETRLLKSRIAPLPDASSGDLLTWPFRIELTPPAPLAAAVEVVMRWDISTIPTQFQTVLLIDHNTLPANDVINMGRNTEYRITVPAGVTSFIRDLTIVVTRSKVQIVKLVNRNIPDGTHHLDARTSLG